MNDFKTDAEELAALRALTRCKFWLLNPKYPDEPNTYVKCTRVTGHTGPCSH